MSEIIRKIVGEVVFQKKKLLKNELVPIKIILGSARYMELAMFDTRLICAYNDFMENKITCKIFKCEIEKSDDDSHLEVVGLNYEEYGKLKASELQ